MAPHTQAVIISNNWDRPYSREIAAFPVVSTCNPILWGFLFVWFNQWFYPLRLSIIWKSDLTDKMKCSFFQSAVVSILLYGCTTWTLTKLLEKLDSNYTRMLRATLNKSWRQHPTRHQLYGHLPPITKTIQVRRTRHAGMAHKWCTLMDIWPGKSRTTSTNIHSAAMWGYRM